MSRFYIAPDEWDLDDLRLTGNEAHHCADVMRMKEGDKLTVFNGEGTEATAQIVELSKVQVSLKKLQHSKSEPVSCRIGLGQAIPKGKNMELIIQKATELGVSEIIPIQSDRTVVRLNGEDAQKKQDKWQKVVIDAAKQCGRNWLPQVSEIFSMREALDNFGSEYELCLIASLQGQPKTFQEVLATAEDQLGHKPESVLILIGPEGDFTPAESAMALSSDFQPVTLGPIVLRTETASIYSLSVLGNALF